MWSGNRSSLAWTLSIREEDVIKKESCILMFFMEKSKKENGKARNLDHPIGHQPDHSSLGNWKFIKGIYSSRNLSLSHI